jgi:hypothetical protein
MAPDRRLLEDGSFRLLEDGAHRLLETDSPDDPTIGHKPLLTVRSFLDTGTEYSSDLPIRHPTRFYEPRLLTVGTLERGIPIPAGLGIIGSGSIELADTPDRTGIQRWRNLLNSTTQRRRKIEVKTGWEGQNETSFAILYIGEYLRATFPPDKVNIAFGDIWQRWINRQIPAIGNRTNFPHLPAGVDTFVFPFVFGNCRIPLQLCDTTTNDYAANQTETNAITAVYRQLPNASPLVYTLVNPSEYTLITDTRTINGLFYPLTLIRFTSAQADGAKLYADIDGMYRRPAFGSMPEVTGSLHNIVDFVICMLFYAFELESTISFDIDSFAATRQKYEDLGLPFDGAIVEPMTFGAVMAQMCASANLHIYQNRLGRLAVALIDTTDAGRPVFTETLDILGASESGDGSRSAIEITSSQPEETINQFKYSFAKNFATGEYENVDIYDNATDQAELGELESQDIEFPFVREVNTARWAIETRARYYTLRSYQVELSLDLPRYAERVELARSLGVTYYGGIGGRWLNKEFVCYGLQYQWDQLRLVVRGIARVALDLEITLEMVDGGLNSDSLAAVTFSRTMMEFNPADYDGVSVYYLEIVGRNVSSTDRHAYLVDAAANLYATVTLPANSPSDATQFKRYAPVAFTPAAAATVYMIKMEQTPSIGDITVTAARIVVPQRGATKTRLQFPLAAGGNYNASQAACQFHVQYNTTSYNQQSPGKCCLFKKESSLLATLAAGTPWSFESVCSTTGGGGDPSTYQAKAGLFNATGNVQVGSPAIENTHVYDGTFEAFSYHMTDFADNALHFDDGDEFEVRMKSNVGGISAEGYRAALYVRLTNLRKALIYRRVGWYMAFAASIDSAARQEIDMDSSSRPPVGYFEATVLTSSPSTMTLALRDLGITDEEGTPTNVTSHDFVTGAKLRWRSAALALNSSHRYVDGAISSFGYPEVATAFILMQAQL